MTLYRLQIIEFVVYTDGYETLTLLQEHTAMFEF
jgi:hypothetical protein